MLFEMATGNFSVRLQLSVHDDEIDQVAALLNKVAENMQSAILKVGYVNPRYTYQGLVQATVILDIDCLVTSFSFDVIKMLGYDVEQLLKLDFEQLLAEQSLAEWSRVRQDALSDSRFHQTIQLIFVSRNGQVVPSFCTVSRLLNSTMILISSITTVLKEPAELYGFDAIPPRPADSVIIQNVYEYILRHLEEPLPTVNELARMFGTNEFKLKDGFRHFFKTSIYQFYNEERLKKAHLLIQQTDFPIKAIALMSGFGDYTNFYKAFKKRFGYCPSEVLRK